MVALSNSPQNGELTKKFENYKLKARYGAWLSQLPFAGGFWNPSDTLCAALAPWFEGID